MANFNTHLFVASAGSAGAALIATNVHLITNADIPWLVFLGIVGGLLPDIDASNSRPVRLLFNVLALMGVAAALHTLKDNYAPYLLLLIATGTYLFIRYVMLNLFNSLTVHRGVFHSLLAALFFGLLMTCISYRFLHWDILHAWLNGVFIAFGFIVHLLLDELYSTNLSNLRMKKSFGTALKLFSYNSIAASALMTLCTIMLYSIAPSPMPLVTVWKGAQWNHYLALAMF
ncbi:MAG: metal-dependent hydrolase [Methylobacter sp.]|uniref:Metal-dependent hydrolase n=1 Tax=Candidatus Methylobacter titanis TaxID=3053457 RepID=A0AA43TLM7_9GAMM|nr:metal-dependent hydrolase [Candidatus Methylobacter titanis]MDI1294023.1 metal-dependent hydrolase [Candidatus Methylobacter titanis]